MKWFTNFAISTIFTVTLVAAANADILSQYDINISDGNVYQDNVNLYQLFNNYFADQLGENTYDTSNNLFKDRGVDPYTDWTTSGSQIVGAFKVAALGHTMSMIDSTGNTVASLINVGGTVNIGEKDGITDLSGQSVTNIPDGLHVSFQLDAYWGSQLVYSWSSNPEENDGSLGPVGDGMIHMIALDITDLYNAKYGTDNDSVFMFCWEDLHLTAADGGDRADWDYQDFVAIVTNVTNIANTTPEPATMLMFGLGLAGLGLVRRKK